jgi:hypothetical protein
MPRKVIGSVKVQRPLFIRIGVKRVGGGLEEETNDYLIGTVGGTAVNLALVQQDLAIFLKQKIQLPNLTDIKGIIIIVGQPTFGL